jgi:hypothetical protein
MKKDIVIETRWEYYVSNVAGFIMLVGLAGWMMYLSLDNEGIDFRSAWFWLALITLFVIPMALISFLSSMKTVVIKEKRLVISYMFARHKNVVNFADVSRIESKTSYTETVIHPAELRDSFNLILNDNRQFDFSRSQFKDYETLKRICYKAVAK